MADGTPRNGGTASPATPIATGAAGSTQVLPAAPAGAARRKTRPDVRKGLEIAFFVTPALAILLMFVVWPVVKAIQYSLFNWPGYGPMDRFVGMDNYSYVLGSPAFQDALWHNLIIVVASIAIQLPLGLAIALLLNRRIRGRNVLRTLVFVPWVLSEVVTAVIWRQLLQAEYGVLDTMLDTVGLSGPTQGFLGDTDYALAAVMVVLTWKYLGLAIVLFLAGLAGVPEELNEASQIDGASWWQTQRRITIPLLGPTVRTWIFLSMIGSIQVFDMVWILTGGGPAESTSTMATFLYAWGVDRNLIGIASAASVVLFVISLVLALVYQRFVLRRDAIDYVPRKDRKVAAR